MPVAAYVSAVYTCGEQGKNQILTLTLTLSLSLTVTATLNPTLSLTLYLQCTRAGNRETTKGSKQAKTRTLNASIARKNALMKVLPCPSVRLSVHSVCLSLCLCARAFVRRLDLAFLTMDGPPSLPPVHKHGHASFPYLRGSIASMLR